MPTFIVSRALMSSHVAASAVLRFAVLLSSGYLAWLVVFERWLDPLLRRGLGVVLGHRIAWLPALGPFCVWGVEAPGGRELDGAVAALGTATVFCAALVPVLMPVFAGYVPAREATIGATHYLLSLPMIGHFLFCVLRRAPSEG